MNTDKKLYFSETAGDLDPTSFAASDFVSLVYFLLKRAGPDEIQPKVEYDHPRWHELNIQRLELIAGGSLIKKDSTSFTPLLSGLNVEDSFARITGIMRLILACQPPPGLVPVLLSLYRNGRIKPGSMEHNQLVCLFVTGLSTPALAFVFGDLWKLPEVESKALVACLASSLKRRHLLLT